jgi:hypothetical protein
LDNVGGRAVLATNPKAEILARLKVGAILVNETGVERRKLVAITAQQKMSTMGKSNSKPENLR